MNNNKTMTNHDKCIQFVRGPLKQLPYVQTKGSQSLSIRCRVEKEGTVEKAEVGAIGGLGGKKKVKNSLTLCNELWHILVKKVEKPCDNQWGCLALLSSLGQEILIAAVAEHPVLTLLTNTDKSLDRAHKIKLDPTWARARCVQARADTLTVIMSLSPV